MDTIILYFTPHLHGTGSAGHDLKFDSLRISKAFTFMIISQNLKANNHKESDVTKYDRKLTE